MLVSECEDELLNFIGKMSYGEVTDTVVPVEEPKINRHVSPEEKTFLNRLREHPEIDRLTIHQGQPQYLEVLGVHEGKIKIKYRQRFKFN